MASDLKYTAFIEPNYFDRIYDIGLHPILREVAFLDPDFFSQVERVFLFDFPLVGAMMLFTKDNRAYVYGENHQEALGFKLQKKGTKIMTKIVRPRELELLRNKKVATIAYRRHVMILTNDGQLFGWGRNDYGPLGVSKGRDFSVRPSLLMENVEKIATYHHTIVLDKEGQVYCCGLNVEKQVNPFVDDDVQYYPMKVTRIRDRVIDVACSSKVSIVLCENNVIYMWGTTQDIVVNFHQSLDRWGKTRKLVVVEYRNYDTWILLLNHERDVHLLRFDRRIGRLAGIKLSHFGNVDDIVGSDHSSFALIGKNKKSLIYLNVNEEKVMNFKVVVTDMRSIADASKLYRIRFTGRLCVLPIGIKESPYLETMRTFNNPSEGDFAFGWDPSLCFPKLMVKKSILIKHCPSFEEIFQGNQFIWTKEKKEQAGSSKIDYESSYKYLGLYYPSYQAMYGFLLFVYTSNIRISNTHLPELLSLAEFFHDKELRNEVTRRLTKPPAPPPALHPRFNKIKLKWPPKGPRRERTQFLIRSIMNRDLT